MTVRSVGERVAIGWLGSACGACRHCIGGWAPAETVAVFGIGGLGHLALQYARIAGGFTMASTSRTTSWPWPGNSAPTRW